MGLVTIITDNNNAGIKHTIILPKSFMIWSSPSLIIKTDAMKGKKNTTGSQIKQIIGKIKKT